MMESLSNKLVTLSLPCPCTPCYFVLSCTSSSFFFMLWGLWCTLISLDCMDLAPTVKPTQATPNFLTFSTENRLETRQKSTKNLSYLTHWIRSFSKCLLTLTCEQAYFRIFINRDHQCPDNKQNDFKLPSRQNSSQTKVTAVPKWNY